jgi:hypothetical protein
VAYAIDSCQLQHTLFAAGTTRQPQEEAGTHVTFALIPVEPQPSTDNPVDLAVVGEILADIVTATVAGQRYLMGKTIKFLERELTSVARALTERQRSVFARWLLELGRQAGRIVPNVRAFNRRAQILTDFVAAARVTQNRPVRVGPRAAAPS